MVKTEGLGAEYAGKFLVAHWVLGDLSGTLVAILVA